MDRVPVVEAVRVCVEVLVVLWTACTGVISNTPTESSAIQVQGLYLPAVRMFERKVKGDNPTARMELATFSALIVM